MPETPPGAGAPPTVWLYGDAEPTTYHDSTCLRRRHCRNRRADLSGRAGAAAGPRARHCPPYCKGQAARGRAFDRHVQAYAPPAP